MQLTTILKAAISATLGVVALLVMVVVILLVVGGEQGAAKAPLLLSLVMGGFSFATYPIRQ